MEQTQKSRVLWLRLTSKGVFELAMQGKLMRANGRVVMRDGMYAVSHDAKLEESYLEKDEKDPVIRL